MAERKIIETDNLDQTATVLILDNGDTVEVDPIDLFKNMVENTLPLDMEDNDIRTLFFEIHKCSDNLTKPSDGPWTISFFLGLWDESLEEDDQQWQSTISFELDVTSDVQLYGHDYT